jgi:hypothetical protein
MGKLNIFIGIICVIALIGCAGATDVTPLYKGVKIQLANGQPMILHNNDNAKNPSFLTLSAALKVDQTDKNIYKLKTYKCTDYAQDVHNNLEAIGIKAGTVNVRFKDGNGHEINVVDTSDMGRVFIDCCGVGEGKAGQDARAMFSIGKKYNLTWLFSGQNLRTNIYVKSIEITW